MSYLYPDLQCSNFLLISNIQILNANTISGPLTYGFPAVSAFLGAVHALSRKVSATDGLENIRLDGVLIANHRCSVQHYRENTYRDFTFVQTRNPLLKNGETAPIIEEGRCHLEVSLIIGVYCDDHLAEGQGRLLIQTVEKLIQQQRIAGGSVIGLKPSRPVQLCGFDLIDKFRYQLFPAFVLTEAHQDLQEITAQLQEEQPEATALDALLATAAIHHQPFPGSKSHPEKWKWEAHSVKQGRGWLVPIPVGYQGISEKFAAGVMQHTRNPAYESQYVEAVYSLGKWKFAGNIENLETALWYQKYDAANDLYLLTQEHA